ncbi:MAG: SufE family protein [Caulobacterales bacterium]|jgi:cysteine desulfuration protein SufE
MSRKDISQTLQTLADDLEFLPDWEERIRHVMDLGRKLPALAPHDMVEANKVRGCASQVWLVAQANPEDPSLLRFAADSDAPLVRGLIALVLLVYSDRTPAEILAADPNLVMARLGLDQALTRQRANGLASMVARIRAEAAAKQA